MHLPEAAVAAIMHAKLTDVVHIQFHCMSFLHQTQHMCRVPARAQRFYRYLHEERHYSQMTLLVSLLAIPLTLGKATVGVHQLQH